MKRGTIEKWMVMMVMMIDDDKILPLNLRSRLLCNTHRFASGKFIEARVTFEHAGS